MPPPSKNQSIWPPWNCTVNTLIQVSISAEHSLRSIISIIVKLAKRRPPCAVVKPENYWPKGDRRKTLLRRQETIAVPHNPVTLGWHSLMFSNISNYNSLIHYKLIIIVCQLNVAQVRQQQKQVSELSVEAQAEAALRLMSTQVITYCKTLLLWHVKGST